MAPKWRDMTDVELLFSSGSAIACRTSSPRGIPRLPRSTTQRLGEFVASVLRVFVSSCLQFRHLPSNDKRPVVSHGT